jgi:putative phosphoesterase
MKIGVISDTHLVQDDIHMMPSEILNAFAGVDLILHCGDIVSLSVLDYLETLCPVIAVEGYRDAVKDPRVHGRTCIVEVDNLRIGMVHDINWPSPILLTDYGVLEFPPEPIHDITKSKFGSPVDVVVFGDTHEPLITNQDGVLFVNPGYVCCLGMGEQTDLGTVAILTVSSGKVSSELLRISRVIK